MAVRAFVLLVTTPLQTKAVVQRLREIPAIAAVHEVMGPYDIFVETVAEDLRSIAALLSTALRRIPGVESTTSLVGFPEG